MTITSFDYKAIKSLVRKNTAFRTLGKRFTTVDELLSDLVTDALEFEKRNGPIRDWIKHINIRIKYKVLDIFRAHKRRTGLLAESSVADYSDLLADPILDHCLFEQTVLIKQLVDKVFTTEQTNKLVHEMIDEIKSGFTLEEIAYLHGVKRQYLHRLLMKLRSSIYEE